MHGPGDRADDRRGTILVIGDADLRRDLAEPLIAAGYHLVTIGNSLDAVAFLRRQNVLPQMIILDWDVPGISGLQFISFHSSSPLYSRTPLAVVAEPSCNNVPRLCVSAILHRPVELHRLVDIVDRSTRLATQREAADRKTVRDYS